MLNSDKLYFISHEIKNTHFIDSEHVMGGEIQYKWQLSWI